MSDHNRQSRGSSLKDADLDLGDHDEYIKP